MYPSDKSDKSDKSDIPIGTVQKSQGPSIKKAPCIIAEG